MHATWPEANGAWWREKIEGNRSRDEDTNRRLTEAATYLVHTLGLSYPEAAHQLGHTDGGELLRNLYAHPDEQRTLEAIARAFEREARKAAGSQAASRGAPLTDDGPAEEQRRSERG